MIPVVDLKTQVGPKTRLVSLVGHEDVLKREAVKVLTRLVVDKEVAEWNVTSCAAGDDPVDAVTPPVVRGRRLVLIHGTPVGSWERVAQDGVVLVALDARFREPDVEVDCRRMFGQRLMTWARARARSVGADLDGVDLERLVKTFGGDALRLEQQLWKLSFVDHVEWRHVLAVCEGAAGSGVADLVRAVAEQKPAEAAEAACCAVESGSSQAHLVGAVARRLRLVLLLLAGRETGPLSEAEASEVASQKAALTWDKAVHAMDVVAGLAAEVRRGTVPLEVLVTRMAEAAGGSW